MTVMRPGVLSLSVISVTIAMAGCSKLGIGQKSPGEVAQAAIMAVNAGKISEYKQYLSEDAITVLSQHGGLGVVMQEMQKDPRFGTVARVEILKEEIRGETAKVSLRVYYKNGQTEEDSMSLIKEKGEWKLAGRS